MTTDGGDEPPPANQEHARLVRANERRPWREADDQLLRRLIELREPPASIARRMQRTQDAIRGRAGQLGLAVPSPLRPWRKHWGRAIREELKRDAGEEISSSRDSASADGD